MKKNGRTGGLLLALVEILVGILLLIDPAGFTSGIIIAAGAVLMALGLYNIILYFRTEPAEAAAGRGLTLGLISLAAGLFCILRFSWFSETFALLTTVYGAAVIALGLGKVQKMTDILRLKGKRWYLAAAGAAVTLICGVLVVLNPFATADFLWRFTGISLLAEALLDVVCLFMCGNTQKVCENEEKQ